jgi:hypothetical protein
MWLSSAATEPRLRSKTARSSTETTAGLQHLGRACGTETDHIPSASERAKVAWPEREGGTLKKCWAAPLGGCSDKISREHVVSASLWKSPAIDVVGFPWCKDQPQRVGVASLTAKILCRTHNTALSDVDAAGAAAFETLRHSAELRATREASPERMMGNWLVSTFRIDGNKLERWFIKTLINIGASGAATGTWAVSGSDLANPPLEFIRAAFGLEGLKRPLGLYIVAALGETIESRDVVESRTLLNESGDLAGALFTFRGFRFFLNLAPGTVPQTAPMPGEGTMIPSPSHLIYHVRRLRNKVGRHVSHTLEFDWR